jgi:clan AA aspartic protease (TIGR02281 family)
MKPAYFISIALFLFICILFSGATNLRAEFYKYKDDEGKLHFVDDIGAIPEKYRYQLKVYKEPTDFMSEEEKQEHREKQRQKAEQLNRIQKQRQRERLRQEKRSTPIIIVENQIFVPVTLAYDGRRLRTRFLLDTGATMSAMHKDIADRLYIREFKNGFARLASGETIRAKAAKLDYIQVGPYRKTEIIAGVIDFQGEAAPHSGLLGMDFLRHFEYSIDFKNQRINWKSP